MKRMIVDGKTRPWCASWPRLDRPGAGDRGGDALAGGIVGHPSMGRAWLATRATVTDFDGCARHIGYPSTRTHIEA
jgi:hypothetical protein